MSNFRGAFQDSCGCRSTNFCLKRAMIPYKMLAKVSLNVMILYELILKKT